MTLTLFRDKAEITVRYNELKEVHDGIICEFQKAKETIEKNKIEIDALREQNQRLTSVSTLRTKDMFGRSCEKTEDLLNKAVSHGGADDKDPIAEDASEGAVETTGADDVDSMAENDVRKLLKEILGDKEKKKKENGAWESLEI